MHPPLSDETNRLKRQIVLLTAGQLALKRLLLELHAQQTFQPQPQTEETLARYTAVELDRLLRQLPAAERQLLDPRQDVS